MNAPAPQEFLTLQEIVAAARSDLAPGPWSYLIGGAETETTVRRNRHALDSIAFRPRVLRDVSRIDTSAKFLNHPVRLPVMLAPIGGLESIVEGGAAAAARAAAQFGVPQMLSSVCQPGLEQTAAAADTLRVFQLYVRGDDAWVDDFARRAKDNGFRAFCLTVDVAVYSRRERDLMGRFAKPWRAKAAEGAPFQAALSWDKVKRFKDKHDLPLIIKGIATVEDAELAVQHGVEVVYVSNHGGRGRARPGAHARAPRGGDPHLPRPARRDLLRRAHAGAPRAGARGDHARYLQRVPAPVATCAGASAPTRCTWPPWRGGPCSSAGTRRRP